jgi:VanZ family protein
MVNKFTHLCEFLRMSGMARSGRITRSATLKLMAGIVVLALLSITALTQPSYSGIWMSTFHEFLHVPVFGIIAVCLLINTPVRWGPRKRLIVVAIATIVLSALSELAQVPGPRDASVRDLMADLLGAAGFILAAIPLSASFSVRKGRGRYLIILGIALVAWPLMPLAKVSAAYVERNQAVPSLVRFDSRLGHVFFHLQNTDLRKISSSDRELVSAEITIKDGPWPGIIFHDLWPDWEPFSALVVEIENPDKEVLPLNIRVHDRTHRGGHQTYGDRFNHSVDLRPGKKIFRIELADIRRAPAERQMDLAKIDGLVIFTTRQQAGRRFILHEIRLE